MGQGFKIIFIQNAWTCELRSNKKRNHVNTHQNQIINILCSSLIKQGFQSLFFLKSAGFGGINSFGNRANLSIHYIWFNLIMMLATFECLISAFAFMCFKEMDHIIKHIYTQRGNCQWPHHRTRLVFICCLCTMIFNLTQSHMYIFFPTNI